MNTLIYILIEIIDNSSLSMDCAEDWDELNLQQAGSSQTLAPYTGTLPKPRRDNLIKSPRLRLDQTSASPQLADLESRMEEFNAAQHRMNQQAEMLRRQKEQLVHMSKELAAREQRVIDEESRRQRDDHDWNERAQQVSNHVNASNVNLIASNKQVIPQVEVTENSGNIGDRFIMRTESEKSFTIRPTDYPDNIITSAVAERLESNIAKVLTSKQMNVNLTSIHNRNGIIWVRAESGEAGDVIATYINNINWNRLNLTPMTCVSKTDDNIYPTIEVRTMNLSVTFNDLLTIMETQQIANTERWRLVHKSIRRLTQAVFVILNDFASIRNLCSSCYRTTSFSFGANNSYAQIYIRQSQLDEFGPQANGESINSTMNENDPINIDLHH